MSTRHMIAILVTACLKASTLTQNEPTVSSLDWTGDHASIDVGHQYQTVDAKLGRRDNVANLCYHIKIPNAKNLLTAECEAEPKTDECKCLEQPIKCIKNDLETFQSVGGIYDVSPMSCADYRASQHHEARRDIADADAGTVVADTLSESDITDPLDTPTEASKLSRREGKANHCYRIGIYQNKAQRQALCKDKDSKECKCLRHPINCIKTDLGTFHAINGHYIYDPNRSCAEWKAELEAEIASVKAHGIPPRASHSVDNSLVWG